MPHLFIIPCDTHSNFWFSRSQFYRSLRTDLTMMQIKTSSNQRLRERVRLDAFSQAANSFGFQFVTEEPRAFIFPLYESMFCFISQFYCSLRSELTMMQKKN